MKLGRAERNVLIVAIVLSLALTTLTIWAVSEQSRTLEQRDLESLRAAAQQSVTRTEQRLRKQLDGVFDSAGWALAVGPAGLNYWASQQPPAPLIFAHLDDGRWQRYPRPGAVKLPAFTSSAPVEPSAAVVEAADALMAERERIVDFLNESRIAAELSAEELTFRRMGASEVLLVLRQIGDHAELALATSLPLLFSQATGDGGARWEFALPGALPERPTLAEFDAAFGGARLVASGATNEQLLRESRRRQRFVLLTAGGTIAAWGLLLWLMVRLVNGQRAILKLQQRIIADVSHELKTPLALIRLHAETLREGRVREPTRQRGYLDTITRESERLTVLLDSILDFSRFERGQHNYEFQTCDLATIARQAWELYEPQFASARFDASLALPGEPLPVDGDPNALQQVMVNLLQNAYRYAGERKYVCLRVKREGFLGLIEVEDRGIGMSRAQLDQLGASFVRGVDPRVRQTRGAGLGLAIVNRIVTSHRGKLDVKSRPNEGSTFMVWLPLDVPTLANPVKPKSANALQI